MKAADYWLVQEFSKNCDAFLTGSTYLYKDRDGKLCFGPLWDFDGSMGSQNDDGEEDEEDVTGFNNSWFCWIDRRRAWFNENIDSIHKSTLKVTYILDGEVVKTEKVNYNSNAPEPPEAPSKEGYIFIGWYCEKEQQ